MTAPNPDPNLTRHQDGGAATEQALTVKRVIIAVVVVNIWIVTLCTAPYFAGLYVYRWIDYSGELPLRPLFPVAMNSMAVLAYILITRRIKLLVWKRPRKPAFIILLLPLIAINFKRGPLIELTVVLMLVLVLTNLCIGFWEEFLFRGLIQVRLALQGAADRSSVHRAIVHIHPLAQGILAVRDRLCDRPHVLPGTISDRNVAFGDHPLRDRPFE